MRIGSTLFALTNGKTLYIYGHSGVYVNKPNGGKLYCILRADHLLFGADLGPAMNVNELVVT